MKKTLLLSLFIASIQCMSAQDLPETDSLDSEMDYVEEESEDVSIEPIYKYRVYLKDKKKNPFSVKRPEEFLSQRAIERRRKQKLKINKTDLPVNPSYIDGLKSVGVKYLSSSKWNNTVLVETTDTSKIEAMSQLPYVTSVRMVAKYTSERKAVPDFALRMSALEYAEEDDTLENVYGKGETQISQLNGQFIHNLGFKGKGKVVAILDAGFINADVLPSMKKIDVLGVKDFVEPDGKNLYASSDHGLMVLSCIGTNEPNVFVGTAPEAAFWLIRTEDSDSEQIVEEDNWAAGVEFADSVGADVINSSLGYVDFDNDNDNYPYSELDGKTHLISRSASMLASKGIVLCNSAGNSGNDKWKKIGTPADATDILAVGAIDANRENAEFSSVGYAADGRVKPDVMAMGLNSTVISAVGSVSNAHGTSFASPIMAGMVTSLWSALPELNAYQIMDIIRRSADRYSLPDNIFGYGIPDFGKAYELGRKK